MIYAFMTIAILTLIAAGVLIWMVLKKPVSDITFEDLKVIVDNQNELCEMMQKLSSQIAEQETDASAEVTAETPVETPELQNGKAEAEAVDEQPADLPAATKPWEELSHKERMALVRAGIKKAEYEAGLKNE
jgi:hypothetical protein